MKFIQVILLFGLPAILLLSGCVEVASIPEQASSTENPSLELEAPMPEKLHADVLSVQVTGKPGTYQFAVEISSPDTGCEQYADWWEVVSEDGQLFYRRVLLHSHVSEQPFTRTGGPVDIAEDEVVYVRGHMNTAGYGGLLMKGSVQDGFEPAEVEASFGSGLERMPPLPEGCAF